MSYPYKKTREICPYCDEIAYRTENKEYIRCQRCGTKFYTRQCVVGKHIEAPIKH